MDAFDHRACPSAVRILSFAALALYSGLRMLVGGLPANKLDHLLGRLERKLIECLLRVPRGVRGEHEIGRAPQGAVGLIGSCSNTSSPAPPIEP